MITLVKPLKLTKYFVLVASYYFYQWREELTGSVHILCTTQASYVLPCDPGATVITNQVLVPIHDPRLYHHRSM